MSFRLRKRKETRVWGIWRGHNSAGKMLLLTVIRLCSVMGCLPVWALGKQRAHFPLPCITLGLNGLLKQDIAIVIHTTEALGRFPKSSRNLCWLRGSNGKVTWRQSLLEHIFGTSINCRRLWLLVFCSTRQIHEIKPAG